MIKTFHKRYIQGSRLHPKLQGEVCAGCTRIGSLKNGLCRFCADVEAIRKNTGG